MRMKINSCLDTNLLNIFQIKKFFFLEQASNAFCADTTTRRVSKTFVNIPHDAHDC